MWMNKNFVGNVGAKYEQLKDERVFFNGLEIVREHRKLLFYAVCKELLGEEFSFETIDTDAPFGSIIGMDNSYLDLIFKHSKIFRLHAAFHDGFGYCKYQNEKGPGYSYIFNLPINSCLLGHVTGLAYWFIMSIIDRETYKKLDV